MRSIRVYLFALVAICVILATTAFAVVVEQSNAINRQRAEAQSRETAKALSQAVDGKLERAIGVLAALRSSTAALSHDWRTLDQQARSALQERDSWIVVQDRQGRQWINTRLPSGSPLPAGPPATEMWNAIASGKPHVCNLVHGFVEQNIVCVDAPISAGAAPDYAITVVFRPNAFEPIVTREDVHAGNVATLVDRSGRVIWRNIRPAAFVGHSATGPMLRAIASPAQSGVLETTSLEGVPMLSGFNRSALSGWSVIVGSPLKQVETASKAALYQGSVLAIAILLLGVALATLVGAKLAAAVKELGEATRALPGEPFRETGITEIDAAGSALARSFAARAESERHQQILIGELNHRVKNTLSIVQSLAHQTFRNSASPKDAIAAFEARLRALAGAHNLLTKGRWEAASIREVIRNALAPFCDADRCEIGGPDVKAVPQTAVSLALALHELATNASKYGALSSESGKVLVHWTAQDGAFTMTWKEVGGPPAKQPTAEGFGMRLIRRSLASELRGAVEMSFLESGLECRITGRLD